MITAADGKYQQMGNTRGWEMQRVSWWLLLWGGVCQLLVKATAICSLEHICGWWCRYQQMGNAVCPMVASALGRCLALAALGEGPTSVDEAVVAVPDLEYLRVSGRF